MFGANMRFKCFLGPRAMVNVAFFQSLKSLTEPNQPSVGQTEIQQIQNNAINPPNPTAKIVEHIKTK